jgi:hypothetical protein
MAGPLWHLLRHLLRQCQVPIVVEHIMMNGPVVRVDHRVVKAASTGTVTSYLRKSYRRTDV